MNPDFIRLTLIFNGSDNLSDLPNDRIVILYASLAEKSFEVFKKTAIKLVAELEGDLSSYELAAVFEFGTSRTASNVQLENRIQTFLEKNPEWDYMLDDEGDLLGVKDRCEYIDVNGVRCFNEGTTYHRVEALFPMSQKAKIVVNLCRSHHKELGLHQGWETSA